LRKKHLQRKRPQRKLKQQMKLLLKPQLKQRQHQLLSRMQHQLLLLDL